MKRFAFNSVFLISLTSLTIVLFTKNALATITPLSVVHYQFLATELTPTEPTATSTPYPEQQIGIPTQQATDIISQSYLPLIFGTAPVILQTSNISETFGIELNSFLDQMQSTQKLEIMSVYVDDLWAYAVAQNVNATEENAIVLLGHQISNGQWQVATPYISEQQEYNNLLNSFPDHILDENTKAYLYEPAAKVEVKASAFNQHALPWRAGLGGTLTRKNGTRHENQIDFDILGSSAAGDVYASKPGKVVFVKESSNSGSCEFKDWKKANMVVIQHANGEYSWYVHLAYNSVPVSVGDIIGLGTKIGVEGETGYACGVHLHYMTSSGYQRWTDPTNADDAPWGTGITTVDFNEVSWANLSVHSTYISQNSGEICPSPNLTTPSDGQTLASRSVTFSWQEQGDCGSQGYTFRIKDTNTMDSGGTTIVDSGEGGTSRPETLPEQWLQRDLYWGVRAVGAASAGWSVRRFRIEPSAGSTCNEPAANEVALFVHGDYGGDCVLKGIGDYSDDSAIGLPNDSVSSVKVGADVRAVLYSDVNFGGRITTLHESDANLSDNDIGNDALSSLRVEDDTPPLPAPPTLSMPANQAKLEYSDTLTLRWNSSANATSYRAEYDLAEGGAVHFVDTSGLDWNLGASGLAVGTYRWQVNASNRRGYSDWSGNWYFTIVPNRPLALTASVISDSQVALAWTRSSGPRDGFTIYMVGTSTPVAQVGASSTTYTVSGLSCGTAYEFEVASYAIGDLESPLSNRVSVTTAACQQNGPAVPQQGAPATGTTFAYGDTITLRWNSSWGADDYRAEYDWTGGGNIHFIDTTDLSWTLGSGQLPVGSYRWQVNAHAGDSWSDWSGNWYFDVVPNAPLNLRVTADGSSAFLLQWEHSGGELDGFTVTQGILPVAVTNANTTSYHIGGATCAEEYPFFINAYKGSYVSAPSAIVVGRIPCAFD